MLLATTQTGVRLELQYIAAPGTPAASPQPSLAYALGAADPEGGGTSAASPVGNVLATAAVQSEGVINGGAYGLEVQPAAGALPWTQGAAWSVAMMVETSDANGVGDTTRRFAFFGSSASAYHAQVRVAIVSSARASVAMKYSHGNNCSHSKRSSITYGCRAQPSPPSAT